MKVRNNVSIRQEIWLAMNRQARLHKWYTELSKEQRAKYRVRLPAKYKGRECLMVWGDDVKLENLENGE